MTVKKPAIAYPGSLIQQNHSEAMEHGFLVWDTQTRKSTFVKVENDYVFYTVLADADLQEYVPQNLIGKHIRLRIQYKYANLAKLKEIIAEFKTKCNVLQVAFQKEKMQSLINSTSNITQQLQGKQWDITDPAIQLELILEYLTSYNLTQLELDEIRKIHQNMKFDVGANLSNSTLKLKRFEFSNLFSYGENNLIDFTNIRGIYGLFGPNATGKTSLLDALTFTIYDKCSKTSKGNHIINSSSDSFTCKLTFTIDDVVYCIEKQGTRKSEDKVSVDINFYMFDDFGQKKSLNGKERSDTNNIIRNLVGQYEDFVITTLSIQNNSGGFIDMSQRERKDLLAQFLNVNVFDSLNKQVIEEGKEISGQIKLLKKKTHSDVIAEATKKINNFTGFLSNLKTKKQEQEKIIEDLRKLLDNAKSKLHNNLPKLDITKLRHQLELEHEKLKTVKNEILQHELNLQKIADKAIEVETKLVDYDSTTLQNNVNYLKTISSELLVAKNEKSRAELELKHILSTISGLDTHKYNPDCEFCVDNEFVKNAIKVKETLPAAKLKVENLAKKVNDLELKLLPFLNADADLAEWQKISTASQKLKEMKQSVLIDKGKTENEKIQILNNLEAINSKIDEYHKIQNQLDANEIVQKGITELDEKLTKAINVLKSIDADILDCNSKLLLNTKVKTDTELELKLLNDLELSYKCLSLYQTATDRDGVPYRLIAKSLPEIESEINNILSQIVEFRITLNCDGKNVNAFIVYDDEKYWALELGSGMEKFISSLAIRTALINQSSLTKSNFLAIDEGFGVLDKTNLNQVFQLFDYLTTQFDFLLIVSHLDVMRDIVDEIIDISKNQTTGKSYINFK